MTRQRVSNSRDDDGDGVVDNPGERLGLTASSHVLPPCASCTVDPDSGPGAYNTMSGLWPDGSRRREYGNGYGQTQGRVTRFAYSGNPATGLGWSEVNNGTASPVNPPGDRRLIIATGPFRLAPGASETVTFAVPYARGTSNIDSVTRLRGLARGIRSVVGDPQPRPVAPGPSAPAASGPVRLSRPFPNPFTSRAVVRYEAPDGTPLRATLHDVLGRQIALLADGPAAAEGELAVDGAGLAPGVYQVRVAIPGAEQVLTLVRSR